MAAANASLGDLRTWTHHVNTKKKKHSASSLSWPRFEPRTCTVRSAKHSAHVVSLEQEYFHFLPPHVTSAERQYVRVSCCNYRKQFHNVPFKLLVLFCRGLSDRGPSGCDMALVGGGMSRKWLKWSRTAAIRNPIKWQKSQLVSEYATKACVGIDGCTHS